MTDLSYERPFQIWSYVVSHRQLLLRSNKSPLQTSRVDVLFKNVKEVKLPTELDRLEIREATTDEIARLGVDGESTARVFVVSGAEREGYVVAGAVAAVEDDKDYHEPSALRS